MVTAAFFLAMLLSSPVVVEGTVSISGSPTAGAQVHLAYFHDGAFVNHVSTTGPDGKYRFERPADDVAFLWATRAGRGVGIGRPVAGSRCDVSLPEESVLTARFVDPSGTPLANTRVVIDQVAQMQGDGFVFAISGKSASIIEAKTDSEGFAKFTGLASGQRVRLDCPRDDFAARMSADTTVEAGATPVIRMDFGFSISGRAMHGKSPVVGAKITAQGMETHASDTVLTDSSGRYRVTRLPADTYNVMVFQAGGKDKPLAAPAIEMNLSAKEPIGIGDLQLMTASVLNIRALGANGEPLAHIHIAVHGPGRPSSGAMVYASFTDDAGRCAIAVSPGKQTVYMHPDDAEVSVEVESKEGESVDVVLRRTDSSR